MSQKPHYLTAAEAATYLGCTVSWIRKLRRFGKLNGLKVGRDWFYTLSELEPHVESDTPHKGRPRVGHGRGGN